jgi:transposase InsO family protein
MELSCNKKRGPYKNHDSDLKRIVMDTGNIELAISRGVARTTAISWITKVKSIPRTNKSDSVFLNLEIESLNQKLKSERAKVQFISDLSPYLHHIKDGKRKISKSVKNLFIKKIDQYLKHSKLSELLSLIKMGHARYLKWRSEIKRCEITKKFECGVRKSNQLTGDEVVKIRTLAVDKKYLHFSLTALWKFAIRNTLVVCSRDTWFKYINLYDLSRIIRKGKKNIFKIGVRAKHSNEVWHLDLTVIELLNGEKVYLQAVIDNFSRFIIDWDLHESKCAKNTKILIQRAKEKLREGTFQTDIYMDSGGENIANLVKSVFIGRQINQIFAQVDVRFSNSMVEAFFRSLKVNFLYHKNLKTTEDLRRCITFYINEYNTKIPHSAFKYETPKEVYYGLWKKENDIYIEKLKGEALFKRKSMSLSKCSTCLS